MAGRILRELAGEFSQDGSRENGGDLGWFRRGDMVSSFEDAAFNLAVNEISEPVESPYGFHIIKVTRRRSGEVRASHILIPVDPTPADLERARRRRGQEVKARLEAGEDFEALRTEFGDLDGAGHPQRSPSIDSRSCLPVSPNPCSRPRPARSSDPVEYEARGETRLAVIKVLECLPAGPYSLEDAGPPELRSCRLSSSRSWWSKILEELRSKTYIQIRM